MIPVRLEVRAVPVSANDAPGAHWQKKARRKRALQDAIAQALIVQWAELVPLKGQPLHATAELRFPARRARRDEGNFRAPLEKALGDALQERGIIPDDTPEWFTFGELTFAADTGPKLTMIKLTAR